MLPLLGAEAQHSYRLQLVPTLARDEPPHAFAEAIAKVAQAVERLAVRPLAAFAASLLAGVHFQGSRRPDRCGRKTPFRRRCYLLLLALALAVASMSLKKTSVFLCTPTNLRHASLPVL